jgi:hypothetical protein
VPKPKTLPRVQLRRPPVGAEQFVNTGTREHKNKRTQDQQNTGTKEHVHVKIPAELKKWLAVEAVSTERDQGDIIAEALELFRSKKGTAR